jgi:hypothetical protein
MLHIIYVADLNDWLEYSRAITNADDTSTSATSKSMEKVLAKLEKDAFNVITYMTSYGLVANPKKTVLMILNNKSKSENDIEIKIGDAKIMQEHNTKLLSMTNISNKK